MKQFIQEYPYLFYLIIFLAAIVVLEQFARWFFIRAKINSPDTPHQKPSVHWHGLLFTPERFVRVDTWFGVRFFVIGYLSDWPTEEVSGKKCIEVSQTGYKQLSGGSYGVMNTASMNKAYSITYDNRRWGLNQFIFRKNLNLLPHAKYAGAVLP